MAPCVIIIENFIVGYYEVDVGLPDASAGMRIMAIADLNNDKLNDLVSVDSSS